MANITITKNDPGGLLAGVPLLDATIRAAVAYLEQYVVFKGTLDIDVQVVTTDTGRFAGTGDSALRGKDAQGLDLWEASLLAESRAGVDPRPATADLTIYIDPQSSYLARLWWDPAIASSLAANPPNDRTDAFSVVLHELLHGMGVVGWRDIESGQLPTSYLSVWDSLLRIAGSRASFDGQAVQALLGEPVEVRLGGSQGAYHLGNAPTDPRSALSGTTMPWLEASNLNGWYFYDGERYTLGRLELAILQDLGWTMKTTTLADVVNRWDDRVGSRYMVGWETDEQLTGDVLDDRIEGRGGRDLLVGLDGKDHLDGGAGNDELRGGGGRDYLVGGAGDDSVDGGADLDVAAYSLARASYAVARSANGAITVTALGGSEGRDALAGVERLWFADQGLAFDLDGAAGLVARLLGVVFGPDALRQKAWVGIGLDLFDAGQTTTQVAQLALDARLGPGATHADIVTLLYTNLFDRGPAADELAFYKGWLDRAEQTPASLALLAAGLELNAQRIDLVGLTGNGIEFSG